METGFDAELFLRLAGERAIVDDAGRQLNRMDDPFSEVGSALVAVGALDHDLADEIVTDYKKALGLRGRHRPGHAARQPSAGEVAPPKAARVVACEAQIDEPWGELEVLFVALDAQETRLEIRARSTQTTPGHLQPGGPFAPLGTVTVADDSGATTAVGFSGGGSDALWAGELTTTTPLGVATRWITVDGTRIDLDRPVPEPPSIQLEPVPGSDGARHLRHRLATSMHGRHHPPQQLQAGIETLVACGAISPDDPVILEVEAVGQTGSGPGASKEWASVLARQQATSDAAGVLVVGTVLPPVDGVSICIDALVATAEGFDLHVATAPGIGHWPSRAGILEPTVAWWATDDRGNFYLGSSSRWSSRDEGSSGTIRYWPAIDKRAGEIRLMPTGPTERAVVVLADLPWRQP